jgi:hypothetical protein
VLEVEPKATGEPTPLPRGAQEGIQSLEAERPNEQLSIETNAAAKEMGHGALKRSSP